ncbi:reverse transcriptase, partial [Fagus crenata]
MEGFVTARLDRVLASALWITEFEGAEVHHLARQNLDHCPVVLSIPGTTSSCKWKKMFRFEAMWTKEGCRASLIAWSKIKFGSLASSIKAKRENLQRLLDDSRLGDTLDIMKLQDDLNALLETEEIFWRQRSRTEKAKLVDIAVDYFQDIFTSSNPSETSLQSCLEGVQRVIMDEMNSQLLEDFSLEEVSQALKQMYPTKAPGPD